MLEGAINLALTGLTLRR